MLWENVVLPSLFNVICRTEINCYFNSTSLLFSPCFLITDSSVHRASCIKGDFGFSQYFHCKNLSQKTPVCTKLWWQGSVFSQIIHEWLQCAQNSNSKDFYFHFHFSHKWLQRAPNLDGKGQSFHTNVQHIHTVKAMIMELQRFEISSKLYSKLSATRQGLKSTWD